MTVLQLRRRVEPPRCACGATTELGRTDRGIVCCLRCWNLGGRGFAWERLT